MAAIHCPAGRTRETMNILSDMAHLLLPRYCPVCGRRLEHTERILCPVCASAMPRLRVGSVADNAMLRPLWTRVPLEHAFALIAYRHYSPFHHLLMRIKYEGDVALAASLGRWVGEEAVRAGMCDHTDVLVPVPLARERQRQRGYNQARLLADGMAQAMRLPVAEMLVRRRQGETQTHLSALQRGTNASGAYHASVPPAWRGSRIALVDDVMTTGSTLAQCAEAILADDPTAHVSLLTLAFAGE